jgi:hypothetical protein
VSYTSFPRSACTPREEFEQRRAAVHFEAFLRLAVAIVPEERLYARRECALTRFREESREVGRVLDNPGRGSLASNVALFGAPSGHPAGMSALALHELTCIRPVLYRRRRPPFRSHRSRP